MEKTELLSKLTYNLKAYIQATGHIKTGKLLNSIKVEDNGQGFTIVGLEYLIYLDEGEFVENFFNLPDTIALLEDYYLGLIEKELDDI